MLHYVMTVQSIWNGETRAAVTVQGTAEPKRGDTRSSIYAEVYKEALTVWQQRYSGRSMGEPVVLFFALEKDAL